MKTNGESLRLLTYPLRVDMAFVTVSCGPLSCVCLSLVSMLEEYDIEFV